MHSPITLKDTGLSFLNKNCFEGFSAQIHPGSRIAIIGRNGCGKSSLINMLRGKIPPSEGEVVIPNNICMGYVEQTIYDFNNLSGGQRLNKQLNKALAQQPNLMLLDEPTNHLDQENRKSLMNMLKRYQGTLIIASHDTELLRHCIDILWHIDNHKIHIITGSYDNYIEEIRKKRATIEKKILSLKYKEKYSHQQLMKEQKRAAKSKEKGKKNINKKKWPTIVSQAKALQAEKTTGKNKRYITQKKQQLSDQLSNLNLPEIILPKFSLQTKDDNPHHIVSIRHANIGYEKNRVLLENISFSISGTERIAICGNNGCGKSTLLKAILKQHNMITTGSWHVPHREDVGYLDQHYIHLKKDLTAVEHIRQARPDWDHTKIRHHLCDFLFKKNHDIMQPAENLSGGEKARLSLSIIAAKIPRLLILDEITNNLDIETKQHITQVLKNYPGPMIIVCHEEDFLQAIGIDHTITILNGKIFNK